MDLATAATRHDEARPVAPGSDSDFTLSLEEVAERYASAGHSRTLRSLQRYCVSGHLDAQKIATATGDKYLVTPQSVERHIAQIAELAAITPVASRRVLSRQDATTSVINDQAIWQENTKATARPTPDDATTVRDVSRQVEPDTNIFEHPYVIRLEAQIEKWEGKYHEQVRRTEEIQIRNSEKLVELQRMTTIGQSKTLAEFMLQARNWLMGGEPEPPAPPPAQ